MKSIIIALTLISSTCLGQFSGFEPLKLTMTDINQTEFVYYDVTTSLVSIMASHYGENIPELDLDSNGIVNTGDMVLLLQQKNGLDLFFPKLTCISQNQYGFIYDIGCGCMSPLEPLQTNLCPVTLQGQIVGDVLTLHVFIPSLQINFEWVWVR